MFIFLGHYECLKKVIVAVERKISDIISDSCAVVDILEVNCDGGEVEDGSEERS